MMPKVTLTPSARTKIQTLRTQGFSVSQIAKKIGCSSRTVHRALADAPELPAAAANAPPAEPGAPLLERLGELYALIQQARAGLPPDSQLASKLATDLVEVGSRLAKMKTKAARPVIELDTSPAALFASIQRKAMAFAAQMQAAGEMKCAGCGLELHPHFGPPSVQPAEPISKPAQLTESPQPVQPAESVESDSLDAIRAELDSVFDAFRALARSATDATVQQKYLRQAGKLAALLIRLDKHTEGISILASDAEMTFDGCLQTAESLKSRPLMCADCSRKYSMMLAGVGNKVSPD